MNIVRWNPLREFDDLFTRAALGTTRPARDVWQPRADVTEHDAFYRIELELPAVAAEDVRVEVNDGVLSVTGERRSSIDDGEANSARVHRLERLSGRFERSFRLPQDADPDGVTARCKDGVLTLEIARGQVSAKAIEIQVG